MKVMSFKSETMVLDQRWVKCPLRKEYFPQVEKFTYLGILFTSDGIMELEMDR